MPAEKTARVQQRRRTINRLARSQSRTAVKRANRLMQKRELEPATAAVTAATSNLDRAARKGVIHSNKAARDKSRLMRKLHALDSTPPLQRTGRRAT